MKDWNYAMASEVYPALDVQEGRVFGFEWKDGVLTISSRRVNGDPVSYSVHYESWLDHGDYVSTLEKSFVVDSTGGLCPALGNESQAF